MFIHIYSTLSNSFWEYNWHGLAQANAHRQQGWHHNAITKVQVHKKCNVLEAPYLECKVPNTYTVQPYSCLGKALQAKQNSLWACGTVAIKHGIMYSHHRTSLFSTKWCLLRSIWLQVDVHVNIQNCWQIQGRMRTIEA